jgi:CheY-like chemotaxis protein
MEVESVNSQKKVDSKIPSKSPLQAQSESVPLETESVKENRVLDLSQLSCLYLEDQLDSQMLFKVQFKDLKSIEFAQSFENALPLLKTKKFDFIVMDINLQGEYNGLDAMRIIQKMPGFKDLPIIASTAYVQPGARDNFIAAGFSEFVSKPLLREKLLDVLRIFFLK